jgi:hypothetical protein
MDANEFALDRKRTHGLISGRMMMMMSTTRTTTAAAVAVMATKMIG